MKRPSRLILILLVLFTLVSYAGSGPDRSGWIQDSAEGAPSVKRVAPVRVRPEAVPDRGIRAVRTRPQAAPYMYQWDSFKKDKQFRNLFPTLTPQSVAIQDTAVSGKTDFSVTAPLTPRPVKFFNGMSNTGYIPPDPHCAAGPNHFIAVVNSSFAIYSKTGSKKFQRTFEDWASVISEVDNAFFFDPKVLYDQYSGHFVMVTVAVRDSDRKAWYILSVSETSDAQGQWWLWALDMTLNGNKKTSNWADYPGLGIDQQAIYLTGNMFSFSPGKFAYAKLRILDKSEVYMFGDIGWYDFFKLKDAVAPLAFTVQPAHSFGTTSTEYLVSSASGSGSNLTFFTLTNPTASKPTLLKKAVPVSSYQYPPDADQKGGGAQINTGDARLLNAVYRDGYIYMAHSVNHDWGSGDVSALRWYQLTTGGTLVEDYTFGADGSHYFYPAIMPDARGNIVIVFNRCSTGEFAGARYVGKRVTDSNLGNSSTLKAGSANYVAIDSVGRNRWGDYNGIVWDSDDSIWIYSEFAMPGDKWGTRAGRVKY